MKSSLTAAVLVAALAGCPAPRPATVVSPASQPASLPADEDASAAMDSDDADTDADDQDLFAAGAAEALAVDDSDGSVSLRSRLKLEKMTPDMVVVQLVARVGEAFPRCAFLGKVLREATSKVKHLRLLGRGRTYRFVPALRRAGGQLDLAHEATRLNLGACYHAPGTKLVIRVGGVDRAAKTFSAALIKLK